MELRKDSELEKVDGEMCRVLEFSPLASVKDGKVVAPDQTTPYAQLEVECNKINEKIIWYVTHRDDFLHLWQIIKERGVKDNEELMIAYSSDQLKSRNIALRKLSLILPKLNVMVCPKGAYEKINDPAKGRGLEGYMETKPIVHIYPMEGDK